MWKGSWSAHEGLTTHDEGFMEDSQRAHERFMEGARGLTKGSWKVHEGSRKVHGGCTTAHERHMEGARRLMGDSRKVPGRCTKGHGGGTKRSGKTNKNIFHETFSMRISFVN